MRYRKQNQISYVRKPFNIRPFGVKTSFNTSSDERLVGDGIKNKTEHEQYIKQRGPTFFAHYRDSKEQKNAMNAKVEKSNENMLDGENMKEQTNKHRKNNKIVNDNGKNMDETITGRKTEKPSIRVEKGSPLALFDSSELKDKELQSNGIENENLKESEYLARHVNDENSDIKPHINNNIISSPVQHEANVNAESSDIKAGIINISLPLQRVANVNTEISDIKTGINNISLPLKREANVNAESYDTKPSINRISLPLQRVTNVNTESSDIKPGFINMSLPLQRVENFKESQHDAREYHNLTQKYHGNEPGESTSLNSKQLDKYEHQNLYQLQQAVKEKFTKQNPNSFSENSRNKMRKYSSKLTETYAYIRGAIKTIPSQTIHIFHSRSKPLQLIPIQEKSLTTTIPKFKKVEASLNHKSFVKILEKSPVTKMREFTDKESSDPAVSSESGKEDMDTSSLNLPSSRLATQLLQQNSNDIKILSKPEEIQSNDRETALSNLENRLISSIDPTDLSSYKHTIDIAERTGTGDVVPVNMNAKSAEINAITNPSSIPNDADERIPSEHVLVSPDSTKEVDIMKSMSGDQDGRLAALQDLQALTKVQKELATQEKETFSNPMFLKKISNRPSISGIPVDSLDITHTSTMPLREREKLDATLLFSSAKLKREDKDETVENKFVPERENLQLAMKNKLTASSANFSRPKLTKNIPQTGRLYFSQPKKAAAFSKENRSKYRTGHNTSNTEKLVIEIVKPSSKYFEIKQNKTNKKPIDGPIREADIFLKSEKLNTKPFNASSHAQKALEREKSQTSIFLPNSPLNPKGDFLFLDDDTKTTGRAGTIKLLSKSNLSNEEKMKLIKEYQDSQNTSNTAKIDDSKISDMLKTGKFTEHDLKSDFAGKEAALQDVMMLEIERDLNEKISQAHLRAAEQRKMKENEIKISQQENAMSLPGNLSPDITLPSNISPGGAIPGISQGTTSRPLKHIQPSENTLQESRKMKENEIKISQQENDMSLPGNLSPDITLPSNISPGGSIPGISQGATSTSLTHNQSPGNILPDTTRPTQMDKFLDEEQKILRDDNKSEDYDTFSTTQTTKTPYSYGDNLQTDNEPRYGRKPIRNEMKPYDSFDFPNIQNLVDSVQGLTPSEIKAYGIGLRNDVYIDKLAPSHSSTQQSLQNEYSTMGLENEGNIKPLYYIRRSKMNKYLKNDRK
ncbi:uncharacterized protein LOC124435292 [Xenia sp. Carnegie-2017]|uniref:uncharacterized protein LOC124435292 n=1 Tax=Xenia sp. Carnegie-2017 TaxID=2897299 RepID=UPI001F0440F2|nr:uncharacterized protein LOC124435292 [Xenia sp. Carnegie-2017]